VVLDAMGGDDAPSSPVRGALDAVRELDVDLTLVGPRAAIEREVARTRQPAQLTIADAPEIIGMAESPLRAVRSKPRSSIVVGLGLVARGEADAFVTAGSTGAAMAGAVLALKRTEGIDHPALGVPFPTARGACLLLDVGANADARAHNLVQFAIMGSVYAERVLSIPRPRVALLSVGEEESKGSIVVQEAHRQLRESDVVNFVGNVEGKDIPAGLADVIVMDGFVGNVLIKFAEGVSGAMVAIIRRELRANPLSMLLGLGLIPTFRRVRRRTDYAEWGGAPLLGVNGVCIIGHGRSNPRAIKNAVRVAADAVRGSVVETIREGLSGLPVARSHRVE
jgi:glycerol-3-phosphate acyltransferase PlsX